MLVAVNCAIATRGLSGSARGLQHLLDHLKTRPDSRVQDLWPTRKLRRSRVWNAGAQAAWDLFGAARASGSADLLVSPCNIGLARRGQGHILVVHDTMVLDHPDWFDPGFAAYARFLFGVSVRGASAIIVPSEFTKRRLGARWRLPPTVVAMYPLAVKPRDTSLRTRRRILMVGATEFHKRHDLGIESVRLAREQSDEDFQLVIVGPPGRAEESVRALARSTDPSGAWIERRVNVSDAELYCEYDSAFVLIQPSSGEGYGLPVGEAAARGLPAVHSGAGSLSEIAPGAVVQPEGARSYSDAIMALLDADAYELARSAGLAAARRLNVRSYATAVDRAISLAIT